MSHQNSSSTPPSQPPTTRTLAVAQRLPPTIIARVAHFASTDNDFYPYESAKDLRQDARSFAHVCRAWRAAGTAALWREVMLGPLWSGLRARLLSQSWVVAFIRSVIFSIGLGWDDQSPATTDAAIVAACPFLTRLEICGYHAPPGALLRHLQAGVDLVKITTVVVDWPLFDRPGGAGRPGALLSPLVLFPFLRSCTRLQSFHYRGWAELVSNPAEAPIERRIRLRSLRLDISNPATSPQDPHAHLVRMRFLLHFDLSRLLSFRGRVHLGRAESWDAIGRMINVEVLSLLDDFELEHGGVNELIENLPALRRLRRFELFVNDGGNLDSPSSASPDQLQRLLDGLSPSITHVVLQVPVPEAMADNFAQERLVRGNLRSMTVLTFDPLDPAAPVNMSVFKHSDEDWFPEDDFAFPSYA